MFDLKDQYYAENSILNSFDDIMDAQFGAPGTQQKRDAFNREAETYCIGQMWSYHPVRWSSPPKVKEM